MEKPNTLAELKKVLDETLSFSKDRIRFNEYFDLKEEPDTFIVRLIQYLDPISLKKMSRLFEQWTGKPIQSNYVWAIPKS